MLKRQGIFPLASIVACLLHPAIAPAQYVVENLGRGVIAIRTSETTVSVGWRLRGTDPPDLAFNVYRATGSASPVKVNAAPLTATTNLVDGAADLTQTNSYTVRPVLQETELSASAPFVLPANAPVQQHLSVPLDRPARGSVEVPPGSAFKTLTPSARSLWPPNHRMVSRALMCDGASEVVGCTP